MEQLSYEKFKKLLENFPEFNENVLNGLYKKYGRKLTNSYFEKIISTLNENEFLEFSKKYSCYFDGLVTNNLSDDIDSTFLKGKNYMYYSLGVENMPLMSSNEEIYYGNILNEGKSNLHILEFNDNLYPTLKIGSIIKSVYFASDYDENLSLVKELKSFPYKLNDESIFKNEIKYLKALVSLKEKPSYEELKLMFSEFDFDNEPLINDITSELALLKKYVIAKSQFFKRNIKLVDAFSKGYYTMLLSFNDVMQEGTFGLIKAINRYDVTKGYRFSTYASYWIKTCVMKALEYNNDTIRKTRNIISQKMAVKKYISEYLKKYGTYPNYQKVARDLHICASSVYDIMNNYGTCISFDSPLIEDSSESALVNVLYDKDKFVDNIVFKKELSSLIEKAFANILSDKEAEIIKKRFGLTEDGEVLTLEEVASEYNVTRERIRQIEKKAIYKLKFRDRNIGLKDYLD